MRTRTLSHLVGGLLDIWNAPGEAIVERWTTAVIRLWLIVLAAFLAFSESLSTRTFEWASGILSIPPNGVYTPRESAVVIIGGEDSLGRTIALSFSELGYTVFMLYPTRMDNIPVELSAKSLNVSSLLYVWHKKKEQSTHGSWGLIAPVAVDTESGAQRAHASETIHAYCTDHSLNLVSLIILPPCHPVTDESASNHTRIEEEMEIAAVPTACLALGTRSRSMAHAMMEPILVVEDYVDLLTKTAGRVIMLSTCAHAGRLDTRTPHRLLDGVHQRVAQNLGYVLDPLGVRVCSVTIGSPHSTSDSDLRSSSGQRVTSSALKKGVLLKIRLTAQEVFLSFTCHQETLCDALHHIVTAKYPKYSYSLGVHPFLYQVWRALPDVLRLTLSSICMNPKC